MIEGHPCLLVAYTTIPVKEAGFIYIYLSYESESNKYAYFDDFKVTHTKSNVVQYNEYYPFGLQTAQSWLRDGAMPNQYLYNQSSELNQATQAYEMPYRQYDPALGRMLAVDPMASKYSSLTPYNYAFNNPVTFNDPSGADPWDNPNYYHGSGPPGSYHYTDMLYSDGGFFERNRGEAVWNDFGRVNNRNYVRGNIMSWNADFYGPVNLGNGIFGLPSQIERAGGPDKYYDLKTGTTWNIDINLAEAAHGTGLFFENGKFKNGYYYMIKQKSPRGGIAGPLLACNEPNCKHGTAQSGGRSVSSETFGWMGVGLGTVEEVAAKSGSLVQRNMPIINDAGEIIGNWRITSKAGTQVLSYTRTGATVGGYVLAGGSIAFDAVDYANGDLSGTRFSYRTGVTTVGLGIGYFVTGGWGALATGVGIMGEHAYDAAISLGGKISNAYWEAANAMKQGWKPFR